MAAEKIGAGHTETDALLRLAAERVLEMAQERAKDVLETAAVKAKDVLVAPDINKRWHIGKEIPIVLIGGVIVQTIGVVIWLTQLSGMVSTLVSQFAEFKAERITATATVYSREDARRDRELIDQKLQAQLPVDREFERRINAVEGRLDRVEHK